jgi:hypothetical protein
MEYGPMTIHGRTYERVIVDQAVEPKPKDPLSNYLLARYYDQQIRHMLERLDFYRVSPVADLRPWWKRAWQVAYWATVGRFKSWLHRDCGE